MITIFINNKPIYLIDKHLNLCKEKAFRIDEVDLLGRLKAMENLQEDTLCLCSDSLDILWKEFCDHFQLIDAAGGIVKNHIGQLLFIYRNGKWDLPKGKVDPGEDFATAALREVQEECGIRKLELAHELTQTFHIYFHKGAYVLKTTHWFPMTTSDTSQPIPQLEEGITQVKWIDQAALDKVLNNTYANIKKLITEQAGKIFTS